MGLLFHDYTLSHSLLPLTAMRPAADLTIGIGSIAANWQLALSGAPVAYATQEHIASLFPVASTLQGHTWHILGGVHPTEELVTLLHELPVGSAIYCAGQLLAAHLYDANMDWKAIVANHSLKRYEVSDAIVIEKPWHLFQNVKRAIDFTMSRLRVLRRSQPLDSTVQVLGGHNIFVEEGAELHFCTLNAAAGPIYIGRGAEVMEGALIRGPFALGDYSKVRMGAKMYGPTAIGKHCKVGGEVDESVVQNYTNKAHDGYIGNACIGSWCNLGADTNCSNLKNNYATVRVYNEASSRFEETGLQFCGLIMGDHSKSGINTMFNTGTVVGPFCNIFGAGFPRSYIPPFSWGGAQGLRAHSLREALDTARVVMARRDVTLSDAYAEAVAALSNASPVGA